MASVLLTRRTVAAEYDRSLAWAALLLVAVGLVMVYSASIPTAESSRFTGGNSAYFLFRQALFLGMALFAATLTFMCGGSDRAFTRAQPLLAQMGKTVVHAGGPGNGQAAKICNNMLLGISMIAVGEAFNLAAKLGLPADKLFDISSKSSGQCWSLTT